ncbi:unnamed protein product, partial [Polarella glacialis]
ATCAQCDMPQDLSEQEQETFREQHKQLARELRLKLTKELVNARDRRKGSVSQVDAEGHGETVESRPPEQPPEEVPLSEQP